MFLVELSVIEIGNQDEKGNRILLTTMPDIKTSVSMMFRKRVFK